MSVANTTSTPSETDTGESFLTAISDALEDAGVSDEHVDRVVAEGRQLLEERDELRQRVDTLEQRLDGVDNHVGEVEEDLDETDEYVQQIADIAARERAELATRVTDLEESHDSIEDPDSVDGTSDGVETGVHDTVRAETPLEQAVNFPPHVAERELSENKLRGRFVARDIKQYATNVMGGWTMSASDMRKVISAYEEGGTVHPETLRRVRKFLDEWGKDETEIRETDGGMNVVVFSDELVDRLVKIREADPHEVVSGESTVAG